MAADPNKLLSRLKKATCLGGTPEVPRQVGPVTVSFYVGGCAVRDKQNKLVYRRTWEELRGLWAEDLDELETRVTATRLAAMGIFALAVPKRQSRSFLTIVDAGGAELSFSVPGLSARELREGLRALQTWLPDGSHHARPTTEPEPSAPQRRSVKERLIELDDLRDSGLLSTEEYAVRRSALLDDI